MTFTALTTAPSAAMMVPEFVTFATVPEMAGPNPLLRMDPEFVTSIVPLEEGPTDVEVTIPELISVRFVSAYMTLPNVSVIAMVPELTTVALPFGA